MKILEVMANMVRQGDITLDDALNRAYDEGYESARDDACGPPETLRHRSLGGHNG